MKHTYAQVILPLAFGSGLTYMVPENIQRDIQIGSRVKVPLGKKNQYTGIVARLLDTPPADIALKEISELIDARPVVNAVQLQFWQWLATYYLCTPGEVMKAALPAGLKSPKRRTPKTETLLSLHPSLSENPQELDKAMTSLARAKKQLESLRVFLGLRSASVQLSLLREQMMQAGLASSMITALVQKNILIAEEVELIQTRLPADPIKPAKQLNKEQELALEEIRSSRQEGKKVCLLHGVTSSGKTEIYIHLIQECLAQGRQVLYLLPEIALTTQLTTRLKDIFGNRLGVYHSACSDAERTNLWDQQLGEHSFDIILGVRSSLFLPFKDLGLIIVDEEHENSYKQQDPAPRYHARNAGIVLAGLYDAHTVLGSATPSIESYYNCLRGKFRLVELSNRFLDLQLPQVLAVNTKELRRKKIMKSLLSPLLIEKMQASLQQGQQIMLFRNRRAYAPLFECLNCGWVPRCQRCDLSLAFHKQSSVLRCHYCGREYAPVTVCPSCGKAELELRGYGTERLEEEVALLFPQARIARMDSDTMRNRAAYEQLVEDFEQGKIDVLIGTQMLTKGWDFDRLQLVGILNADSMLNFPDFRAHEHAYQLMTQVSGRAGRKTGRGIVIIQTSNPEYPVIQYVLNNDYSALFQHECRERFTYAYPPYSRLIEVWLKHKDEDLLEQASAFFAARLSEGLKDCVFGPVPPVVARVKGVYAQKIILKIKPELSLKAAKDYLCQVGNLLLKENSYRRIQVYYDVDPL